MLFRMLSCIIKKIRQKLQDYRFNNEVSRYNFNGQGNKILVLNKKTNNYEEITNTISGLNVTINGNNNHIKLKELSFIKYLTVSISDDNNQLLIGEDLHTPYPATINNVYIFIGRGNCNVVIGDNPVIQPGVVISCIEPNFKCYISKNVKIAGDVKIYAADSHPIRDSITGKVINYGKNKRKLKIGDNCWLGMNSFISKNTELPNFTIVGAQSFVSGHFEKTNTIIAGNPAKVIKENVIRIDRWQDVNLGE